MILSERGDELEVVPHARRDRPGAGQARRTPDGPGDGRDRARSRRRGVPSWASTRSCSGRAAKRESVEALRAEFGVAADAVAFIGDDLLDIPAMQVAGLAVTVADAPASVKAVAHVVARARGGHARRARAGRAAPARAAVVAGGRRRLRARARRSMSLARSPGLRGRTLRSFLPLGAQRVVGVAVTAAGSTRWRDSCRRRSRALRDPRLRDLARRAGQRARLGAALVQRRDPRSGDGAGRGVHRHLRSRAGARHRDRGRRRCLARWPGVSGDVTAPVRWLCGARRAVVVSHARDGPARAPARLPSADGRRDRPTR